MVCIDIKWLHCNNELIGVPSWYKQNKNYKWVTKKMCNTSHHHSCHHRSYLLHSHHLSHSFNIRIFFKLINWRENQINWIQNGTSAVYCTYRKVIVKKQFFFHNYHIVNNRYTASTLSNKQYSPILVMHNCSRLYCLPLCIIDIKNASIGFFFYQYISPIVGFFLHNSSIDYYRSKWSNKRIQYTRNWTTKIINHQIFLQSHSVRQGGVLLINILATESLHGWL